MKKEFLRAAFSIAFTIPLCVPSAALAGKGAFVRIYNLTDTPLELKTEVDGFSGQSELTRTLSGRIPPRSAFPANGTAYVEESNLWADSILDFNFTSRRGDPRLQVRYTHKFKEHSKRDDEELFITSALYGFPVTGGQWVINIFVSDSNFTPANWMSQIRDNVNLAQLLIPGTHDTVTFVSNAPFVATQTANLREQLEAGVRYFDLRGGFRHTTFGNSPTNILTHHGIYALWGTWFTDVFDDTVAYLRKHPEEAVLLQVTIDNGDPAPAQPIMEFLTERYGDYFFTENRIPDLGEARGKIVLLNRFSNNQKLGFNVSQWASAPSNAPFKVQDKWGLRISTKPAAAIDFFNQECRPSVDPVGRERLNINFLSFADPNQGVTPFQGALGVRDQSGWVDGVNMRIAKFLNGLGSIPNFQAAVPMDAVLDEGNSTDGFVAQLLSYNFRRYGKRGDTPRVGRMYYLRPKTDPEDVLTVTLNAETTPKVSLSRRLRAEVAAGLQTFFLEPVEGNLFRLRTIGRADAQLYLQVVDGSDKVTSDETDLDDPNQLWRLDRWRGSDYFSIISAANPSRMLTLASGNRVLAPVKRTRDDHLWMFDFVE